MDTSRLEITPGKPLSSELTASKWSELVRRVDGASRASGAGRVSLRPNIDMGTMGRLFVEDIYISIQRPKVGQKVPFGISSPAGAYIIGFAGSVGASVVSIKGSYYVATINGVDYELLPEEARSRSGNFFSRWQPQNLVVGEAVVPPAQLARITSDGFTPDADSSYLLIDSTDGQPITACIWITY